MKRLSATATADLSADGDAAIALLVAVDRYPSWHPDVVRSVEVLERDGGGGPLRVAATLRVSLGPIPREIPMTLTVTNRPPGTVTLTRLPNEPSDDEEFEATWRVTRGSPTRLELRIEANLDIPRLLPLDGLADELAAGFVAAARAALEDSADLPGPDPQ